MAIISSKKQPHESGDKQPKQRRESAKTSPEENILQPKAAIYEQGKKEESIRPQLFADNIGQKDLKDELEIDIKEAQSR